MQRRSATPAHAHDAQGVPTLLCASGRGGSGTTLVSALLAVAAAGDGYRVLLIDADEHVGPLALTLGVTPRASWQDVRGGQYGAIDVATPLSTHAHLGGWRDPRCSLSATRCQPRWPNAARACGACVRCRRAWISWSSTAARDLSPLCPQLHRMMANDSWRVTTGADPIALARRPMHSARPFWLGIVPFHWMYSSTDMTDPKPLAASKPSMPVLVSFWERRCTSAAPSPATRRSMPPSVRGCPSPTRRQVRPQR